MTTHVYTGTIYDSNTGLGIGLQQADDAFISRSATVLSTYHDQDHVHDIGAIYAAGHNSVSVAGDVYGYGAGADFLGGSDEMFIFDTAHIGSAHNAISIAGGDSWIYNDGALSGVYGILITGGGNYVLNTGKIIGSDIAISLGGAAGTSNEIDNQGELTGRSGYGIKLGNANDHVTNSGLIRGGVDLGNGTNIFDVREGGRATGSVRGGSGADKLFGGGHDDWFVGLGGNDILKGYGGDDTLTGSAGRDTLTGGAGDDHFVFAGAVPIAADADRIADFSAADDVIGFQKQSFAGLGSSIAATEFVANKTGLATNATTHLIYDTDDGRLYYDPNGNGSGGSVLVTQLSTRPHLTFHNFELV